MCQGGFFQIIIILDDFAFIRKDIDFLIGNKYHIIIRQYRDDQYWYEIIVDGESKQKLLNSKPEIFSNVELHASTSTSNSLSEPFSSDLGNICFIQWGKCTEI